MAKRCNNTSKQLAKTKKVEVAIRRDQKHSFIADIRSNGRDEQGREVAPNGIKWKV